MNYTELKLIGRKPKIHSFIFYEGTCDDITGVHYSKPSKRVYMVVKDPTCMEKAYGNGCPCIPDRKVNIINSGDDNDVYCMCFACNEKAYYTQVHLPVESKFFKGAVTAKINEDIYKEVYNENKI